MPTLSKKELKEEERKELFLLNALGDDEYQRLFSRLSPRKPHELLFYEFIEHLKKQFHIKRYSIIKRYSSVVLKL